MPPRYVPPKTMGWVHAGGVERYCPIAAGSALPTLNTGDVAASLLRANADPSEEANHCGPVMSLSSVAHLSIVINVLCIVLFSVQAVSSAQSVVSSSETQNNKTLNRPSRARRNRTCRIWAKQPDPLQEPHSETRLPGVSRQPTGYQP